MRALQPKTNELLEKLRTSITEPWNTPSEIELWGISRDAKNIDIPSQRWSIESMIAFVKGDTDEGIRLSERAVMHDPYEAPLWTNYASALNARGFFEREWDVIARSIVYKLPAALSYAHTLAAMWADFDRLKEICAILDKMELTDRLSVEHLELYEVSMSTYEKLNDVSPTITSELRTMAAIARQIAEDEHLFPLATRITHDGEDQYGFICGVDTTDPYYLVKLDNMLFDRLIAQGVKSKNCIAFFESITEEE